MACDQPGQSIVGSSCVACDPSCQTCSGGGADQCLTCISGKYFYAGNSSCLSCNVGGFYISGDDCLACDSTCKSCSGPEATDCLSCFPDEKLTSENSCVTSNNNALSYADVELVAQTSSFASSSEQIQDAVTSALPLLANGAGISVVLLAEFAEDIKFYRFINVQFPQNFIDFCRNVDSSSIPNPYQDLGCVESEVGKFADFEISTCFLVNSGDALNREALALGLIAMSWTLSWLLRNQGRLAKPFISMRTVHTWNTFINYFVSDFKEFILYSLLDLSQQQLSHHRRLSEQDADDDDTGEKSGSRFSYGMSIVMLISYFAMFVFFGFLLNRKKKKRNTPPDVTTLSRTPSRGRILPESDQLDDSPVHKQSQNKDGKAEDQEQGSKWMEVPQAFNCISSDLKNNSWFSRNFLLISEFGGFVTVVSLVFLQGNGTLQASFYFGIALILLMFVLIYKPFETKLQTIVFAFNYISRLVMGAFAIVIGEKPDEGSTESIGKALIGVTLATTAINTLVAVFMIFQMIRDICRKICQRRKARSSNKTHPLPIPGSLVVVDVDVRPIVVDQSKIQTGKSFLFDKEVGSNFQIAYTKNRLDELDSDINQSNFVKDENTPASRNNSQPGEQVPSVGEFIKKRASESYYTTKLNMIFRKPGSDLNSPSRLKISLEDVTSPVGQSKVNLDTFSTELSPLKNFGATPLSYFRKFNQSIINNLNSERELESPRQNDIGKSIEVSDAGRWKFEGHSGKKDDPEK